MKRSNAHKVLFQCDDVELIKDFDQFCDSRNMNRSSMLRKYMYEAVGKFKQYKAPKFFAEQQTR